MLSGLSAGVKLMRVSNGRAGEESGHASVSHKVALSEPRQAPDRQTAEHRPFTPTSTPAEIDGATKMNSETPASPSATWFKWKAGQMTAHRLEELRQRDEEAGEPEHREEEHVRERGRGRSPKSTRR